VLSLMVVFFFFSSRRRHTRCYRDWSSDVCSSDLVLLGLALGEPEHEQEHREPEEELRAVEAVRTRRLPVEVGRPNPEEHGGEHEIGRASCRERVERAEAEGRLKRKRSERQEESRI